MIEMVKIVGEIGSGRIVRGPREIWVISPIGIVNLRVKDYVAASSRPRSCVPAVLDESKK